MTISCLWATGWIITPAPLHKKKDQMLSRLSDVLKTRLRENVVKVVHRPDSKKLTDGSIE